MTRSNELELTALVICFFNVSESIGNREIMLPEFRKLGKIGWG
jgi:hypothetical protein